MSSISLACIAAMIFVAGIKFLLWLRISPKRFTYYLASYIRLYSQYDIHDMPNDRVIAFCKVSNFLNFIFWSAAVFFVVYNFNDWTSVEV